MPTTAYYGHVEIYFFFYKVENLPLWKKKKKKLQISAIYKKTNKQKQLFFFCY